MIRHLSAVAVALCLSTSPLYAQTNSFTITVPSADVHKYASIASPVIATAPRGTVLEIKQNLGSWVAVSWPSGDNGVAHMHKSSGTIGAPVPAGTIRAVVEAGSSRVNAQTKPTTPSPAAAPATGSGARVEPAAPQTIKPVRRPTPAPRPVFVAPSHAFGFGGRLGESGIGVGASLRAWRPQGFGIQLALSRSELSSSVSRDKLGLLQIEPSVLYDLPDHVGSSIWTRPYVGSGINVRRQTLKVPDYADPPAQSGFGIQAIGGGEFTFAGAPNFALSTDLNYRWSRDAVPYFNMSGFGFSMSVHWYLW